MSCVSRRLATSASDFVNSPTAAPEYFLHDPKLSVLAHYLRSKTPNLYKSWEYYLMVYVPERARMNGGNTCINRTPDLQRKQPKPVRAAISSADIRWSGIALEQYSTPACLVPRHEHLEHL